MDPGLWCGLGGAQSRRGGSARTEASQPLYAAGAGRAPGDPGAGQRLPRTAGQAWGGLVCFLGCSARPKLGSQKSVRFPDGCGGRHGGRKQGLGSPGVPWFPGESSGSVRGGPGKPRGQGSFRSLAPGGLGSGNFPSETRALYAHNSFNSKSSISSRPSLIRAPHPDKPACETRTPPPSLKLAPPRSLFSSPRNWCKEASGVSQVEFL